MAKKKSETKTIIEETVPDGTTLDNQTEPGEFTFDNPIVKVKVYRLVTGKTKPSFCFERIEEISEAELQSLYGAGTYSIETHFENGQKRNDVYEIAEPPADQSRNNRPRSVEEIQIEMYKEQSKMNRDLLMAVLGRGSTQSTMQEIAQMWAIMQGSVPGATNGVDKMLDVLMKGMELGSKGSGEMDWKQMLVSTIKDVAPTVTQALAQHALPNNGNGAPVNQPVPMNSEQMLKFGIQELKTRIIGGLPVGFAIEWAQLNANNPQYQPLIMAAVGKSFEELCAIDNELANEPYATWLKSFQTGVRSYIQHASETDEENE